MAKIRKAASAQPVKNTGGRRVSKPKVSSLADRIAQASAGPVLEFDVADVELKASSSGKVGMRVTTLSGVSISWWSEYADGTTWADLLEDIGNERYRVRPGVRVAKDGGLIPASAPQPGGFWGE